MAKVNKQVQYFARIGSNRMINGLMHIIVRNDMDTDDAIEEYYHHWDNSQGSGGPDDAAQDAHPFNNTKIDTDPNRTGLLRAIGDYDSFLYFVTVAGSLKAHEENGSLLTGNHDGSSGNAQLIDSGAGWVSRGIEGQIIKNTTDGSQGVVTASTSTQATFSGGMSGGTDNDWDSGDVWVLCNNPEAQPWRTSVPTHSKCQSFVRYQLLGRHNNVDGHSGNNYLHYGLPVNEYGCTAAANGAATILVDQSKIGGSERLIVNQGRFSDQNFGAELSGLNTNNTYFSPVSLIEIWGKHTSGTPNFTFDTSSSGQFISGVTHYALTNHDTAFYNLVVDIDFFGYENPDEDTVTFFRNKVNIFFQPFGESAQVQFSQTPGTSFTY